MIVFMIHMHSCMHSEGILTSASIWVKEIEGLFEKHELNKG